MNVLDQGVLDYSELETREEREERLRNIEALTPLLGAEDAEIAANLDAQMRNAPKHQIAKLGADFIRERLNAPSALRQLMKLDGPIDLLVVSKKP